jgi:hypothetical protein
VGGPDLTQRGPDLSQGVLDRTQRFGLRVQGSDAFSRRSGPTDGILEYITSYVRVASLGLFTARLEITARALCLHTVVRGTLIQGTDTHHGS